MGKKKIFLVAAIISLGILAVLLMGKQGGAISPSGSTSRPAVRSLRSTQESTPISPTASTLAGGEQGSVFAAHNVGDQQSKSQKDTWDALFLTPIKFYGRVVDEKGDPIPGAKALVSFVDSLDSGEQHTKKVIYADATGGFEVEGHGLSIVVQTSKDGYYHLKESDGTFGYARAAGQLNTHANPDDPALFVLRRKGQPAKLIHIERNYLISKKGDPVEVDLHTGQITSTDRGDIRVQVWTFDQGHLPNSHLPYEWKCRVSVPHGGLMHRVSTFDFDAPASGYAQSDEIAMPISAGAKWRSQAKRDYFLQLSGGRYARVEVQMVADGDHFFVVNSYLNPEPNARNLEFDPSQEIKP